MYRRCRQFGYIQIHLSSVSSQSCETHRESGLEMSYNQINQMMAKLQWVEIDLVAHPSSAFADTRFRFDMLEKKGDVTRVQLPHPEILEALTPGKQLLLCSIGSAMVANWKTCCIVPMHFWMFGLVLPSPFNSARTIQSRFTHHSTRIYGKNDLYAVRMVSNVDRLKHALIMWADMDYHTRRI